MSKTASATEGGIRSTRYEFYREATPGEFVDAPTFKRPSDNVTSFEWSPDGGVEPREGLGTADIVRHDNGPEEHEITLEYDLQRFPVDVDGEPDDLSGDGLLRAGPQNALPNTHGFVRRQSQDSLSPGQTVNGDVSKNTRVFTVMVGGRIDSVSYSGDPSSDQPVVVEVTYMTEKVRHYQIDQPDTDDTVEITNDGSQSVDVTIEDEGAVTSETLTVAAGATETTTETFGDIDAVKLSTDLDGDLTIAESTGDELAVIRGSDYYGHGEGDQGIPALGEGTREGEIGTDYEMILSDEIQQPVGSHIAFELNSVEFNVENNVQSREQIGTPRMALSADNRSIEIVTTIVGETESVRTADQHLAVKQNEIRWSMNGGYLEGGNAALTDFGGVSDEIGESAMALDNTFTAEDLEVVAE